MPDEVRPRDANPDEASLRLRAGLKTCHAMVATYRGMIASDGDGVSEAGGPLEPSDEPGSEMEDFLPETEAAPDRERDVGGVHSPDDEVAERESA